MPSTSTDPLRGSWQRYRDSVSALSRAVGRSAEAALKALVKQSEDAAERAERALDEVLARSEERRRAILDAVRSETTRVVSAMRLARQDDLDRLDERVAALERRGAAASDREEE